MPSHMWGDEFFQKHGKDLCDAISYCIKTWKRYGRIGTHGKEKYGTFRDQLYLWDGGIWFLFFPGYVWIKPGFWHFIHFYFDDYITKPFTKYTGLYRLGLWYQAQVYNYAVQKMCKKYPNIVDEIVSHLDGYRMVKPGVFGKISGKEIHNRYWDPPDND